jgi:dCTP deaminase
MRAASSLRSSTPAPDLCTFAAACFLIWYADLDPPSPLETRHGYDTIPSELTGPIAGGLQSFAGLLSKINENDKKLTERVGLMERDQAVLKWAMALAVGALITLGLRECSIQRSADRPAANAPSAPSTPARQP